MTRCPPLSVFCTSSVGEFTSDRCASFSLIPSSSDQATAYVSCDRSAIGSGLVCLSTFTPLHASVLLGNPLVGRTIPLLDPSLRLEMARILFSCIGRSGFDQAGMMNQLVRAVACLPTKDLRALSRWIIESGSPVNGDPEIFVSILRDYIKLMKRLPEPHRRLLSLSMASTFRTFPVGERHEFCSVMPELIGIAADASRLSDPSHNPLFARVLFHWAADYPRPDEGRVNYDNFSEGRIIVVFRRALKSILKLKSEGDILHRLTEVCGKTRWTSKQVERLSYRLGIKRPWVATWCGL